MINPIYHPSTNNLANRLNLHWEQKFVKDSGGSNKRTQRNTTLGIIFYQFSSCLYATGYTVMISVHKATQNLLFTLKNNDSILSWSK